LLHGSTAVSGQGRARAPLQAVEEDFELRTEADFELGQKVEGIVSRCSESGAFVSIGHGRQGFLPTDRMDRRLAQLTQRFQLVGKEVTAWIRYIRPNGKVVLDCQDPGVAVTVVPGQELQGRVMGIIEKGAFIDVGADRDGFVRNSEMSYDRVEKVDDVLSVGKVVTVWVKEVRPDGRIDLTLRRPVDLSDFVVSQRTPGFLAS